MKTAEQVVFGLLGLSLTLFLFVVGGYAVHRITYVPPLYATPLEGEGKRDLQKIMEASDLESLRQTCAFWVEFEDGRRTLTKRLLDRFGDFLRDAVIAMGFVWFMITLGLSHVYLTMRRANRTSASAP